MLNYNEFKSWLESQDESTIVGRANRRCGCPIACFLRGRLGHEVEVLRASYRPLHLTRYTPLPEWARAFVVRIDRLTPSAFGEVTANLARRVLNQVVAGTP